MGEDEESYLLALILIYNHAQHEYAMASSETDGTKCLKKMIRHHCVDDQSRKSIWLLMVGCSCFAFLTWHGGLSLVKKI